MDRRNSRYSRQKASVHECSEGGPADIGVTQVKSRDRLSWRQMISCGDTQYVQVEEEEDFPMLNLP